MDTQDQKHSECRSNYFADTGEERGWQTRLIACSLPRGHEGDHQELIDGEVAARWEPRPSLPTRSANVAVRDALADIIGEAMGTAPWYNGPEDELPDGVTYDTIQRDVDLHFADAVLANWRPTGCLNHEVGEHCEHHYDGGTCCNCRQINYPVLVADLRARLAAAERRGREDEVNHE